MRFRPFLAILLASICLALSSRAQTASISTNNVGFNVSTFGLQPNQVTSITVTPSQFAVIPPGFFLPPPMTLSRANYPQLTNGYAVFSNQLCGFAMQVTFAGFYSTYTTNYLIPSPASQTNSDGSVNAAYYVGKPWQGGSFSYFFLNGFNFTTNYINLTNSVVITNIFNVTNNLTGTNSGIAPGTNTTVSTNGPVFSVNVTPGIFDLAGQGSAAMQTATNFTLAQGQNQTNDTIARIGTLGTSVSNNIGTLGTSVSNNTTSAFQSGSNFTYSTAGAISNYVGTVSNQTFQASSTLTISATNTLATNGYAQLIATNNALISQILMLQTNLNNAIATSSNLLQSTKQPASGALTNFSALGTSAFVLSQSGSSTNETAYGLTVSSNLSLGGNIAFQVNGAVVGVTNAAQGNGTYFFASSTVLTNMNDARFQILTNAGTGNVFLQSNSVSIYQGTNYQGNWSASPPGTAPTPITYIGTFDNENGQFHVGYFNSTNVTAQIQSAENGAFQGATNFTFTTAGSLSNYVVVVSNQVYLAAFNASTNSGIGVTNAVTSGIGANGIIVTSTTNSGGIQLTISSPFALTNAAATNAAAVSITGQTLWIPTNYVSQAQLVASTNGLPPFVWALGTASTNSSSAFQPSSANLTNWSALATSSVQPSSLNLTNWSGTPTNTVPRYSDVTNTVLAFQQLQSNNVVTVSNLTYQAGIAASTNIAQNTQSGGVVSGPVTNEVFSTAGTNAINSLVTAGQGISAATATNISGNTIVGGVVAGVVTNETVSAAGTNVINTTAWSLGGNNVGAANVLGSTNQATVNFSVWNTNTMSLQTNLNVSIGNSNSISVYVKNASVFGTSNSISAYQSLISLPATWDTDIGAWNQIISGAFNVAIGSGNIITYDGGSANFDYAFGATNLIEGFPGGANTANFDSTLNGMFNTNDSLEFGIIGNGIFNTVDSYRFEAILDGSANYVHSSYGLILNGNAISIGTSANGGSDYSTVLNGTSDTIGVSSPYSFIGVASGSTISGGQYAFIPYGAGNAINGSYAAAIGANITIGHNHTTIINDGNPVASGANNELVFSFANGVGINTNNPGTNALRVAGNIDTTVGLTVNGVPYYLVISNANAANLTVSNLTVNGNLLLGSNVWQNASTNLIGINGNPMWGVNGPYQLLSASLWTNYQTMFYIALQAGIFNLISNTTTLISSPVINTNQWANNFGSGGSTTYSYYGSYQANQGNVMGNGVYTNASGDFRGLGTVSWNTTTNWTPTDMPLHFHVTYSVSGIPQYLSPSTNLYK